ncbi:MAG: glycosyltransferase [Bacteroidales bacterium]|nr:glycosyltransferase [Bacteroidales bacterium]
MSLELSIIVPVYNVSAYLEECLDSIACQTLTDNVECILVDDCGTDDSMSIAENFITGYSGDILFSIARHECNKGLSGARNTGLSQARGKYVMFLDSDDKLTPDSIVSLLAPLHQAEYDMVIGEYSVIGGRDVFMHTSMPEGECLGRNAIATARCKHQWYPMAWGKVYRKSFLEDNSLLFLEGILHEDELFSSQLSCVIRSMYCTKAVCYEYRVRDNSIMTSSDYARRLKSCSAILERMYTYICSIGMEKDPVCNDLLYNLFSYSSQMALRSSECDSKSYYSTFRDIVNRHYGERFFANRRLRAFIRDAHFLLPEFMGRIYYRFISNLK